MRGYWFRHRLFFTIILSIAVALMTGILFAFPYISQLANEYNSQSIYKNSDIDFIAPEPSFEQISQLSGTNGIDKVFPFYLTRAQISVNGLSQTATVLLSDQFENVDITMFNERRLIEKSSLPFDNPILADWQFCHNTSSSVGDTVSFSINGKVSEYRIYAIYETSGIYDNGTLLVQISTDQRALINETSQNNGYSGMYISADDYSTCRSYLTTDYRPLGRLKDREQFESNEQYQIHYDAIMGSGYANEITDFRVRENVLNKEQSGLLIWVGVALDVLIVFVFNVMMSKRGCEKNYFTKHCIPKGRNVKPYYVLSFWTELISIIVLYAAVLMMKVNFADEFISPAVFTPILIAIPVAVTIAEIISFFMNNSMVTATIKEEKVETEGRDSKIVSEEDKQR